MTLNDYQDKAKVTAVFPEGVIGKAYVTLGLIDEAGELYRSIGWENERKETGDTCWYFAMVHEEFGLDISFTEQEAVRIEPTLVFYDVKDAVSYMMLVGTEICGLIKKYIRDERFNEAGISEEKKERLHICLAEYLLSIYFICGALNFEFNDVLQENLDKLYSRKDRGVLKGSGDDR